MCTHASVWEDVEDYYFIVSNVQLQFFGSI